MFPCFFNLRLKLTKMIFFWLNDFCFFCSRLQDIHRCFKSFFFNLTFCPHIDPPSHLLVTFTLFSVKSLF
jgi:hypothetical protein